MENISTKNPFMKPIYKISILLVVLLFFTNCFNTNERHLGEWKGADDHGTIGSIILDKNNQMTMTMYDSESEANEYGLQQKKCTGRSLQN